MADAKKKKKSGIVAQAEAKANKIVNDREKAKVKDKKGGAKKPNGIVKYFKDLRGEIKKVTWPSWGKVVNNTAVVLVGMCVSAIVVWGIDSILTALLTFTAGQ